MARRLETERYLALVRQLIREEGSRDAAAGKLGVTPTYITKLQGDPSRNVGLDALNRAKEALSLRPEFFDDEAIGDAPDYHAFVEASVRARSGGPRPRPLQEFIDSFDPDDPQAPGPEEITWLEGQSFRELRAAGLEITPSLYGRLLRERRAQLGGRTRPPPTVEPPQPRAGRRKVRR